jgi:hypothetical protein
MAVSATVSPVASIPHSRNQPQPAATPYPPPTPPPHPQVVTTTIEPKRHTRGSAYDAYEYTAHSHTYMSDATPTAKFTYDLSPIQVGG